jgi:hypothetical protein
VQMIGQSPVTEAIVRSPVWRPFPNLHPQKAPLQAHTRRLLRAGPQNRIVGEDVRDRPKMFKLRIASQIMRGIAACV